MKTNAPTKPAKGRALLSDLPPEEAVLLFEWLRLKRAEEAAKSSRKTLDEKVLSILTAREMATIDGATLSLRRNASWNYSQALTAEAVRLAAAQVAEREGGAAFPSYSFTIQKTEAKRAAE